MIDIQRPLRNPYLEKILRWAEDEEGWKVIPSDNGEIKGYIWSQPYKHSGWMFEPDYEGVFEREDSWPNNPNIPVGIVIQYNYLRDLIRFS